MKDHYTVYGNRYRLIPIEDIVLNSELTRDRTIINTVKFYKNKTRINNSKKQKKKKRNIVKTSTEYIEIDYMINFFEEDFPLPPVKVKPIGNGKFSLIDGRHRLTVSIIKEYTYIPVKIINTDIMKFSQRVRDNIRHHRHHRQRYIEFKK